MTQRRRRLLLFAGIVACAAAAAFFALYLAREYPQGRDLEGFRWAAHRGVTLGWTHIYDRWIQDYGDLPIVAWLYTPLLPLSYAVAYPLTLAVSAVAAIGAWALAARGDLWTRVAWLGALLAFLPLWNVFSEGQPTAVILLLLAFTIYSLRRGWAAPAGLALATAIQLKPQVAFLAALTILVAGERRAFLWWLAGSAFWALAYFAVLGPRFPAAFLAVAGDYLHRSTGLAGPMLGSPVAGYGVRAVLVLLTLVAARQQRGNAARALAIGVVASLIVSPYSEMYDLVVLFAAGWTLQGLEALAFVPGLVVALLWFNSVVAVELWEFVLLATLVFSRPAKQPVVPGADPEQRQHRERPQIREGQVAGLP